MKAQAPHQREDIILSLATEMLRSFGEFQFVAWGSSMVPALFPGDTLVVRRAAPEDIRAGQVVLLAREGRLYAHRLVDKRIVGPTTRLITRGDALGEYDPPFTENELLGRVAAVTRRGKRIELFDDARMPVGQRLLRWIAQRSDSGVKWMLRWHSLRVWLSRTSTADSNQIQWEPEEAA